eukprot:2781636-Pyramimonas_sp.AAC.1
MVNITVPVSSPESRLFIPDLSPVSGVHRLGVVTQYHVYSHGGPIRRRKYGYILAADQSPGNRLYTDAPARGKTAGDAVGDRHDPPTRGGHGDPPQMSN